MPHLVNGVPSDSVTLQDRGLQYGDGLFETIAVRGGRLEFWQRHIQRLALGCQRLGLPAPDAQLLLAEVRQLLAGRAEAVIKIVVTRGQGGRGYRPPESGATHPNRIIALHDWPDYPAADVTTGVKGKICTTPLGINPALAGVKHLNRLEQVLARNEWRDNDIFEGIMFDAHGHVVEGTMSNLFLVKEGTLQTPNLSNAGVAGIMRAVVMELASATDIPLASGHYKQVDILAADELFITNSLIGIRPLRQLEQQHYRVGPLTQQLIHKLNTVRADTKHHETV